MHTAQIQHMHRCRRACSAVPPLAPQSAVNLLSSVLDTPEFFWRAPDSYQTLYEAICQVWWGPYEPRVAHGVLTWGERPQGWPGDPRRLQMGSKGCCTRSLAVDGGFVSARWRKDNTQPLFAVLVLCMQQLGCRAMAGLLVLHVQDSSNCG